MKGNLGNWARVLCYLPTPTFLNNVNEVAIKFIIVKCKNGGPNERSGVKSFCENENSQSLIDDTLSQTQSFLSILFLLWSKS